MMLKIIKMQIKPQQNTHFTPIRMASIQKQRTTSVGEDVGKLGPCAFLVDQECKGLAQGLDPSECPLQDNTMEGRVISVMRIMHFIQFLDDETVL
jgi:hypothetical protein